MKNYKAKNLIQNLENLLRFTHHYLEKSEFYSTLLSTFVYPTPVEYTAQTPMTDGFKLYLPPEESTFLRSTDPIFFANGDFNDENRNITLYCAYLIHEDLHIKEQSHHLGIEKFCHSFEDAELAQHLLLICEDIRIEAAGKKIFGDQPGMHAIPTILEFSNIVASLKLIYKISREKIDNKKKFLIYLLMEGMLNESFITFKERISKPQDICREIHSEALAHLIELESAWLGTKDDKLKNSHQEVLQKCLLLKKQLLFPATPWNSADVAKKWYNIIIDHYHSDNNENQQKWQQGLHSDHSKICDTVQKKKRATTISLPSQDELEENKEKVELSYQKTVEKNDRKYSKLRNQTIEKEKEKEKREEEKKKENEKILDSSHSNSIIVQQTIVQQYLWNMQKEGHVLPGYDKVKTVYHSHQKETGHFLNQYQQIIQECKRHFGQIKQEMYSKKEQQHVGSFTPKDLHRFLIARSPVNKVRIYNQGIRQRIKKNFTKKELYILIDKSGSTDSEICPGQNSKTVLDIEKEAAAIIFCAAKAFYYTRMFAFSTRHDTTIMEQIPNCGALEKIYSGGENQDGVAIREIHKYIKQRPKSSKKLIITICDGYPNAPGYSGHTYAGAYDTANAIREIEIDANFCYILVNKGGLEKSLYQIITAYASYHTYLTNPLELPQKVAEIVKKWMRI